MMNDSRHCPRCGDDLDACECTGAEVEAVTFAARCMTLRNELMDAQGVANTLRAFYNEAINQRNAALERCAKLGRTVKDLRTTARARTMERDEWQIVAVNFEKERDTLRQANEVLTTQLDNAAKTIVELGENAESFRESMYALETRVMDLRASLDAIAGDDHCDPRLTAKLALDRHDRLT